MRIVYFFVLGFIFCAVSLPLLAADKPYQVAAPISHYENLGVIPPTIDGFINTDEWQYTFQGSSGSSNWNVLWDQVLHDEGRVQGGLVESIEPNDVPTGTDDCSFMVWTLYDDEFLYIAVRVNDLDTSINDNAEGSEDGSTWYDDSIEIFIDGDLSQFDTPITQASAADQAREYATGGQFVLTAGNARRDAEAGDPTFGETGDWFARSEWTATGYEAEFQIKLSKIGNPTKGTKIGFNIAVNDDDDNTTARFQLRWTGEAHRESTYGTLFFGPREITAPLIDGPITIDGVLDEPDWVKAAVDNISPYEGVTGSSTWPTSVEDLSCVAKVMHDDIWLYVAVTVIDEIIYTDSAPEGTHNDDNQPTWHDDSVEVFIDHDFSHDGSNSGGVVEGQFVVTAGNATRDTNTRGTPFIGSSDDDDWWGKTTTTDTGWIGELRLKKEFIASFDPIGFSLGVNDDDGDTAGIEPRNQLRYQGSANNEITFGVLHFGGPVVGMTDWMVY